ACMGAGGRNVHAGAGSTVDVDVSGASDLCVQAQVAGGRGWTWVNRERHVAIKLQGVDGTRGRVAQRKVARDGFRKIATGSDDHRRNVLAIAASVDVDRATAFRPYD